MSTISETIARDIIAGKYAEDRPIKVVTYSNMFDGGLTWGVVFAHQDPMRYERSPACHNVRTVWTAKDGLTPYAKVELKFDPIL